MTKELHKKYRKWDIFCLFFFFVAIFAFMPTARTTDRNIWMAATLLLCLNVAWRLVNRKKIPVDNAIGWYLLVVMWGAISCIWSLNTSQFELYVLLYASVIIVGTLCVAAYISDEADVDRVMMLIIVAGCIAGLRFCWYTPWDSILKSGYYMRGTFGSLLDDVTNYNNYTSHLCIINIIAGYYAIVKKKKWCYIAYTLLFAILIFGGSRKNLVVIPLITIYFAISSGSVSNKLRNFLLSLAVVICGFYALMTLDFLSQIRDTFFQMITGVSSSIATDASTQERLYLIDTAKQVWWDHPILGVGWDNFRYYNGLHVYAHNSYFELLACTGIIGFCLYYYYYLRLLGRSVMHALRGVSNEWDMLVIGVMIGFLIQEYGAITLYGRERMIMLLIVSTAYSIGTGNKVKYMIMRK